MQNHDDEPGGVLPEAEGKSDALLKAFASALGREFDRISYPAAPARTNQLAHDLGLGRMQAYRTVRGDAMPSLKALVKLVSLGVSLDAVLAQLVDEPLPDSEISVAILGQTIRAMPLPAYGRTPFAITKKDGRATLRVIPLGEAPGADDLMIGGLRFTRPQPKVAIVDDDTADLAVLQKEIGQGFSTYPFMLAEHLLEGWDDLVAYDAFVIDWRLPDMGGAELIERIRSKTRAPIIVTTGERGEGRAISEVLHLPHVRYVPKPVDGAIVRAMIEAVIGEVGLSPVTTERWAPRSAQPSA